MFAQKAEFVKGKNYKSFIFPKEHPIWGFPPESGRYAPIAEDIARAEKILKDNICTDYFRGIQQQYKTQLINKRTIRKYTRQYIGYLKPDGNVIIRVYLHRCIKKNF